MQPKRTTKQRAFTTKENEGTNGTKHASQFGHEMQQSHLNGDKKQSHPSSRNRILESTVGHIIRQLERSSAAAKQQNPKRAKVRVDAEEHNSLKKGWLSERKQQMFWRHLVIVG